MEKNGILIPNYPGKVTLLKFTNFGELIPFTIFIIKNFRITDHTSDDFVQVCQKSHLGKILYRVVEY